MKKLKILNKQTIKIRTHNKQSIKINSKMKEFKKIKYKIKIIINKLNLMPVKYLKQVISYNIFILFKQIF